MKENDCVLVMACRWIAGDNIVEWEIKCRRNFDKKKKCASKNMKKIVSSIEMTRKINFKLMMNLSCYNENPQYVVWIIPHNYRKKNPKFKFNSKPLKKKAVRNKSWNIEVKKIAHTAAVHTVTENHVVKVDIAAIIQHQRSPWFRFLEHTLVRASFFFFHLKLYFFVGYI